MVRDVESGKVAGASATAWATCLALLLGLGVLLTVILVPLSISSLEYYEYGFLQRRITDVVQLDKPVYYGGRHVLGPNFKFYKYDADVHLVEFNGLSVTTSDKLETLIDFDFIYFLKKDELAQLQRERGQKYTDPIISEAKSTIKNTAVLYPTEAYFQNRSMIEDVFYDALSAQLQDKWHITVPQIFLGHVQIPEQVRAKQLNVAVQTETNKQQVYTSTAAVTRKVTDQLVNAINNNATILIGQATAQADLIVKTAQSEALVTTQHARSAGLQKYYSAVNATDAASKASLDYIRTLSGAANFNLLVGDQTSLLVQNAIASTA